MGKPAFCMRKHGREADQRLCFRYTDSTIPLLPKVEISSLFCDCTAWFVWDLVGNPEDRFSHNEAHIKMSSCKRSKTIQKKEGGPDRFAIMGTHCRP